MSFEYLQITKEQSYGTIMTSPSAGVDSIYIRLADSNRFGMRKEPVRKTIGYGGGRGNKGYQKTGRYEIKGDLSLELCYTQALLLLNWASTPISTVSSPTTPWPTTEISGDLPSCTVFHGTVRSDGSARIRGYSGTKVSAWNLACGVESNVAMLKLGLLAQQTWPTDPTAMQAPAPADTAFPTDVLQFYQLSTGLSVGGSGLVYPESFTLDVKNDLDGKYFTSQNLVNAHMRGRETTLEMDVLYTASPEWRTLYEGDTIEAVQVAMTNSTHTVTLNLYGNNEITKVTDSLEVGKQYMQNVTLENMWDTSIGNALSDLIFTFA